MVDTTVALLGTGTMGAGMARSMQREGLTVRAWNRTPDRSRPLADDGITVVERPEEAVEGAAVVVTMVSDADAVIDVAGQVLSTLADGAVWAQMGTIGVAGTDRAIDLAEDQGVALVDAPVSGTKQPAEEGKLVVLVAGSDDAVTTADPVFAAVGSRTVRLGDRPGAATRMKLVVNTWLLELVAALGESVSLAEILGLRAEQFLDVIADGPLDAPYAQLKGKAMASREYPPSFALKHADKDARLGLDAAGAVGLHLPVAAAVAKLFDTAAGVVGQEDLAAVREVIGHPAT